MSAPDTIALNSSWRDRVWRDPVWAAVIAAVIAAIILAALTWLWGKLASDQAIFTRKYPIPLWLIIVAVSVAAGTYWRMRTKHERDRIKWQRDKTDYESRLQAAASRTYSFVPQINRMSVEASIAAANLNLTYPLKCSVYLKNDSPGCIDVALAGYEKKEIPIKKLTQGVLQTEVPGAGWVPDPHGADRIAVLPGQTFRLWIPIDEKKYTRDEVQGSRGQIGTVILNVNGETIRIGI